MNQAMQQPMMMQQILSQVKPQNQGIYRTGEDACLFTGSIQFTDQISNRLGVKEDVLGAVFVAEFPEKQIVEVDD